MRRVLVLALPLAVGIVVGLIGEQVLSGQREPMKRTILLKTDLSGLEGKEGIVLLTEFNPEATTGRHYHHGHEFAHVLEGSGTFEREGKTTIFKPGDTFHIPPNQVHNVKNDGTAPVKALVFVIHEKGEPIAVPKK